MSFNDKNMQKGRLKQHAKRGWNREPSTASTRTAKEGSGEVIQTAPMPEKMQQHRKTMALVKPKEAPMPEPVCESQDGGWKEGRSFHWWPLIEYFVWNTVLWEVKCEVNPQAMASHRQKWWNGSETWNYTHLRVRSVYLGLAKQRQRRKRK